MQQLSAHKQGVSTRPSTCPAAFSTQTRAVAYLSILRAFNPNGPRPILSSGTALRPGISRRQRPLSVVVAAAGKPVKGAGREGGGKGFGASNAPSVSKSGVSQTCACGSKVVYRQCCEPYHLGVATPPDVETALRARFCAFVKGRVPYLVSTFHPSYHSFKYEGSAPGGSRVQLRRDVVAATKRFTYSNLKILEVRPGSHADEAFITFRYNSFNKVNPERNVDGSILISTTVERSRFLRDRQHVAPASATAGPPDATAVAATSSKTTLPGGGSNRGDRGTWLFADYELIDYPTWMEEAKQAELRARGQMLQGGNDPATSTVAAAA